MVIKIIKFVKIAERIESVEFLVKDFCSFVRGLWQNKQNLQSL
jgi:hypothetical protein